MTKEEISKKMKKIIFRAKLSHNKETVEGQLIWIEGKPHIIRDCDIEECGHHFKQCSDVPTWVDEDSIELVCDCSIELFRKAMEE